MYIVKVFKSREKFQKPILVKHLDSIEDATQFINRIYTFRPQYFCTFMNEQNLKLFYAINRSVKKSK